MLIFIQHFLASEAFLLEKKRKDNNFISLLPNKTKCKIEQFEQSSLTVLKKLSSELSVKELNLSPFCAGLIQKSLGGGEGEGA